MRRRGVELKLHLGESLAAIDASPIGNIAKARHRLAMITGGKSFGEIAEREGTLKRRMQDVVDLALLASDILDAIVAGKQPEGLTSGYLIKTGFPTLWSEQRVAFAAL